MAELEPGTKYDAMPIPPIPEHTRWVPAGSIKFAVEYRLLTDDILDDAYAADEQGKAVMDAARPEMLDDKGLSIHVFQPDETTEMLRFDIFDDDPHYHYITAQDGYQRMVHFDAYAGGDMLPWTLDRLRSRLPEMLVMAHHDTVAADLDLDIVAKALDEVEAVAQQARAGAA